MKVKAKLKLKLRSIKLLWARGDQRVPENEETDLLETTAESQALAPKPFVSLIPV